LSHGVFKMKTHRFKINRVFSTKEKRLEIDINSLESLFKKFFEEICSAPHQALNVKGIQVEYNAPVLMFRLKLKDLKHIQVLKRKDPNSKICEELIDFSYFINSKESIRKSKIQDTVRQLAEYYALDYTKAAILWYKHMLEAVVQPLLILQTVHGLILPWHKIPCMIMFRDGLPIGLYLKHAAYIKCSRFAKSTFKSIIGQQNIWDESKIIDYTMSYLMVPILNSLSDIIASNQRTLHADELLKVCYHFLRGLYGLDDIQDTSIIDYLLKSTEYRYRNFQQPHQMTHLFNWDVDSDRLQRKYQNPFHHIKKPHFEQHTFQHEKHLQLFKSWMHQPRVAFFWEQKWCISALRQYIDNLKFNQPYILYLNKQPAVYVEVYDVIQDELYNYYDAEQYDLGLHIVVGSQAFRGAFYFDFWLSQLILTLFQKYPKAKRIVLEPRIDNTNMHHRLKSFGFKHMKQVKLPHKEAIIWGITQQDYICLWHHFIESLKKELPISI